MSSFAAVAPGAAVAAPQFAIERVRLALLWLMGFAGAFVFIEPSPYEIIALMVMLMFAASGLSMRSAVAPLMALLIPYLIGFAIAVVQISDQQKPVTWVLISIFLAATAIFYAAILGANTQARLRWLVRGTIAAAVIASFAAIAGYFHLVGGFSEQLVLYSRARGTFNDPNVLGAFLVLPGLILFQRMLAGRLSNMIKSGAVLLLLLAALFLSFSRGAWAQFAFSAAVLMGLTFITSRSPVERMRIVVLALIGMIIVALFVVALLSIPQVAELFSQRASLEQSYDLGQYGRFGRYILGVELGLERPLGIGPLQFALHFGEDPHNTYLNTFMSGGWLTGLTYLTLTMVTLVIGLRFIRVETPWQPIYHAVYAAYLGVAAESAIIDSDHWRHYFLILGLLWGLMAVSRTAQRELATIVSGYLTRIVRVCIRTTRATGPVRAKVTFGRRTSDSASLHPDCATAVPPCRFRRCCRQNIHERPPLHRVRQDTDSKPGDRHVHEEDRLCVDRRCRTGRGTGSSRDSLRRGLHQERNHLQHDVQLAVWHRSVASGEL